MSISLLRRLALFIASRIRQNSVLLSSVVEASFSSSSSVQTLEEFIYMTDNCIRVGENLSASWCGPCRQITPLYVEMSEKYPQLVFLTIDVDELTDLSSSWDICAPLAYFFLKNGQHLYKLVGANKPELKKKIITFVESVSNQCSKC